MSAVPSFGPLQPTDSLIERIERIWGITPNRRGEERRVHDFLVEVDRRQSDRRFVDQKAQDPDEGRPYSWADAPTTGFIA